MLELQNLVMPREWALVHSFITIVYSPQRCPRDEGKAEPHPPTTSSKTNTNNVVVGSIPSWFILPLLIGETNLTPFSCLLLRVHLLPYCPAKCPASATAFVIGSVDQTNSICGRHSESKMNSDSLARGMKSFSSVHPSPTPLDEYWLVKWVGGLLPSQTSPVFLFPF